MFGSQFIRHDDLNIDAATTQNTHPSDAPFPAVRQATAPPSLSSRPNDDHADRTKEMDGPVRALLDECRSDHGDFV